MKSAIWISYDLGVRGDYEGLYTWLDEHEARDCGDGLAFLQFEYKTQIVAAIKRELKRAVSVNKRTRIYVIYRDRDSTKIRGIFIFGRRKAAPWVGYAGRTSAPDLEEF